MASAATTRAVMAANTFSFPTQQKSTTSTFFFFFFFFSSKRQPRTTLTLRASSEDAADCNVEECAPEKEVGKVSVEWLAGEKTKVSGTFPPRSTRGWTGYVEKDTAGQTNIYSVEPPVYVAESVISSGSAGSSSAGSENTAAVAFGFALISIAAASSILFQVSKNSPPQVQKVEYSGPSLSYYINKFKPEEVEQAPAPSVTEVIELKIEAESSAAPETSSEVQIEPEVQPVPSDTAVSATS